MIQPLDTEREFEKIFKQHFHKVVYYSYSYVNDYEKARNVAQDAFCQLWRLREEVNFQESPLPLVLLMAKRISLNVLRNEKCQRSYLSYKREKDTIAQFNIDALEDASATLLYTKEVQELLQKGLKKMPEPAKDVFLLSRDKRLKYKEIAAVLNISPKTVENRMTIALSILRKVLKDYLLFFLGGILCLRCLCK